MAELKTVGITARLPGGQSFIVVPSTGHDRLVRTTPRFPRMIVLLANRGAVSCEALAASYKGSGPATVVDAPTYRPNGYHSKAIERTLRSPRRWVRLCVDTPRGSLTAGITYDGDFSSADFLTLRPLLEEVAVAMGVQPPPPWRGASTQPRSPRSAWAPW